jgi:hypothetical protein
MRLSLLGLALLAGLGDLVAAPSPVVPGARREQHLHFTAQDREVGRYQYVPVTVPAGTTRLTIAYGYDKAGGANVMDLGLFEPGSLDLGTPAFRGWSGGAASEIFVGTSAASPGYWPGPLPAGEWHVLLGLYKVGPAGVDVTLTAETSAIADPAPVPTLAPRPTGPLRSGPAWFSGGVHLHTRHSDGEFSTEEVCRRAREAGHDFVVITDHNNTTHQLDPVDVPGLLRLVGEEVTTPGGHASVLGIGGWRDQVDFRLIAGDERIRDLVRAANERGALFAINHPRADCLGCSWEHNISAGVAAMEISAFAPAERAAAMALWDSLLQRRKRIVGIGSSDWHRTDHPIGAASVRVWAAELSEKAILDAIRAGRVVVMADGATPPPELVVRSGSAEARIGDDLTVSRGATATIEVTVPRALARGRVDLVQDGAIVDSAPIASAPIRFERTVVKDAYLRVHVHAVDGSPVAVTNPVYLEVPGARGSRR